jgi:MEDS: MEthanogen/methylotroph, DcmR Sensory domain
VSSAGPHDHAVMFYDAESELAEEVAQHLGGTIRDGGVAIVVATTRHRIAVEDRLEQQGVDLGEASDRGCYAAFDADAMLAQFMINGYADPAGFWRVMSPVLKWASRKRRKTVVFGEMVALLWARDQATAAADVEALWNEMASHYSFSLLCAYPAAALHGETDEVLAAHSAVSGSRSRPAT